MKTDAKKTREIKTIKCFYCKKILTRKGRWKGFGLGESLDLTPFICKKCWLEITKKTEPEYQINEWGRIKILDFKCVTQEKNSKVICLYEKCGCRDHSIGDVVIFIDCKFCLLDKDHKIEKSGGIFIIPPKKYWCSCASND